MTTLLPKLDTIASFVLRNGDILETYRRSNGDIFQWVWTDHWIIIKFEYMKHVLMELMDCTYYLNTKKSSVRFDFWCNDVLLCKMWFSCFGLHDMDWNDKAAKKERRFAFNRSINNWTSLWSIQQGNHFFPVVSEYRTQIFGPNWSWVEYFYQWATLPHQFT